MSPDRGPAVRKLDPADPTELQAFLSGVVGRRRVLHATGALSEVGARLLMALVEQSVRKGCAYLRLDLDGVMAIDTAGLRARRQFQANMRAIGVTLRFADPHRRITRVGLRPLQAASPGVLA